MTANAATRDELLAHASELLGYLSKRRGFDPSIIQHTQLSLVELQALCRILYELLYNPPPRSKR